jgi:hypothetical protein
MTMPKLTLIILLTLLCATSVAAQNKRLWVVRSGEVTEYDPVTFAQKQVVKAPTEADTYPESFMVNHLGQMLFAIPVSLPFNEGDLTDERKVWFWDGHAASELRREVVRDAATVGSNLAVDETASMPHLAANGKHFFWSSNHAHRLTRDGVDLSTANTWKARETDLTGGSPAELADVTLPECSCPTGGCEETCPYQEAYVPDDGVTNFFLLNQFVPGKNQPVYKATSLYKESEGKWTATPIDPPLRRVLDAPDASTILEAIPDTGCCGWANQSDDQTLLHLRGKTIKLFDELEAYKNPDYDVSFYTENGKLSPDRTQVAFTIVATSKPNAPIQLAEQGQANPEESQRIRKALLDLPAVEVKSVEDPLRRLAFLPHATLVGWISDKELLIVENNILVAYNLSTGGRRKSSIRVSDTAHVFLR